MFYPKNHLDNSSLILKSEIPRKPLFLDCSENNLILFTSDSFFYQYLLIPQKNSHQELVSIKLTLLHQVAMAISSPPLNFSLLPLTKKSGGIRKLRRMESLANTNIARCLILNSSGSLVLSNTEEHLHVTLANSVEQFWVANYSRYAEKDLGNTLWAYGQSGLQVKHIFSKKNCELISMF